jgi:hypothetical protein
MYDIGKSKTQKSILDSNNFIKYYTGGTTHNRRLLTNNDIYKIAGVEVQVPIIKQPICEHCERICVWTKTKGTFGQVIPTGYCSYCGTMTKNPLTYGEFLANGYDIPAYVVGKDREQSIAARKLLNIMLNTKGRNGVDKDGNV